MGFADAGRRNLDVMALRHAILAALLDGESSGYDLAKGFDSSVANFWSATPQQMYRELDAMDRAGLTTSTVVVQQGRPNKRLFTLTDAGRRELSGFASRQPKGSAIRDDLLVQMQAVDFADQHQVIETLRSRLAASESKLRFYLGARDRMLDGRTERDYLAHAERIGPYLTLLRGIAFEQENIGWCERAVDVLTARGRVADRPRMQVET